MKRDFDLVRLLLLDVERHETVDLSAFSEDEIKYHKALIIEAGLVEGGVGYPSYMKTDIPHRVSIKRLTWDGHEFLDKARSDTVWTKAKGIVVSKGMSLSFEALKVALSETVKTLLT